LKYENNGVIFKLEYLNIEIGLEGFVKSGLNKLNFDEISFFPLQYGGRVLFGFGTFLVLVSMALDR